MTSSKFHGFWSGLGAGAQFAKVHLRVWSDADGLHAYGIARTLTGEVEVLNCIGREESETRAVFDLVDYVTDNPTTNPPSTAQIIATYQEDPELIDITFATDIGTHGLLKLRRAKFAAKIQLRIPSSLQKTYRRLKHYIRFRLRYFYLVFVLYLAVLSIFGRMQVKLTAVEVIVLLFPLIFLFSDRLRELLSTLALRKLGPIEFQEQGSARADISPIDIVNTLSGEFGDKLSLYSTISQYFVLKTKAVLRLMATNEKPITHAEYIRLAKGLGVPDSNLQATLDALEKSGCITIGEDGKLVVQDIGKQFIAYEERLAQLKN